MSIGFKGVLLCAALAGAGVPALADEKLIDEARDYLKKGETKAAIIQLKNVLQDEPKHVNARLLLGEAFLVQGDIPAAVQTLEKLSELGVSAQVWSLPLGRAYLLKGDAKALLERIRPSDEMAPELRASILGLRGTAQTMQNEFDQARLSFDDALKLAPDSRDLLLGLATLEARQEHYPKAVEYAQKVLDKDPQNVDAWFIVGEAKRLNKDLPGATLAFGKGIEIQPRDFRCRLGRATVYLATNRLAEAEKDIGEVLAVGKMPMALYLQAMVDFQGKKLEEAEDNLGKVVAALPDYLPGRFLYGAVAYQRGKFETAETQLSYFIAKNPDQLQAIKLLAATRMKLSRPAEALSLLLPQEAKAKQDPQLLALLGSAYQQNKQFDLAIDYLNRASALAPKEASVKAQLAMSLIATGKLDLAVGDLRSAVELDPALLQADTMLVLVLLQQKKFDEAIEAAYRLKSKTRDDPMAENLLGTAYLAKGDGRQASEHWKAALKLKPEYASAALNLARIELGNKQADEASRLFEGVLKHDPKNLGAWLGLAQIAEDRNQFDQVERYLLEARENNPADLQPSVLLSKFWLRHGRPLKALDIARDMLNAHPDHPLALQSLGLAEIASNQNANATDTFRKLVSAVPDNAEYRYQLGQALFRSKNHDAAVKEWQLSRKIKPDYLPPLLAQGEIALQGKKYDEAGKIAAQAKAEAPTASGGFLLEGDTAFARKDFRKALGAYETAFKLESTPNLARRLFYIRHSLQEDEQAFGALNEWVQAHPDDVESWQLLGLGYQETNRLKEAAAAYEKGYAIQPQNPVLLNNLAWVYQELGDPRAVSLAEKLLSANENAPLIQDTIGWIFVQNGRVDKGLALLQDASIHAPEYSQIRYHLAAALLKADRKKEAREELQILLKSKRDFPDRKRAEELLQGL